MKKTLLARDLRANVIGKKAQTLREAAEHNYAQIIQKEALWTDLEFPPVLSSLYDPNDKKQDAEKYNQYTWRRVSEIYDNPQLFVQGSDPADINQGQLGDCYFLAVLSSLCSDSEDIANLFVTKKINAAGCYMVRFFINGVETFITVDDYLPCSKPSCLPAFATSKKSEFWVSILEKAWAKLHGSYAAVAGGAPDLAFNQITGCPAESITHEKVKDRIALWI